MKNTQTKKKLCKKGSLNLQLLKYAASFYLKYGCAVSPSFAAPTETEC